MNTTDQKNDPSQAKSTEIFMNISTSDLEENTARAVIGFFMIWTFEKNLADFSSPKIDKNLVLQLHKKEITISDFVKDSLKDEITSHIFLEEADSFAKYYFKWKYIADCKKLLGETFEGSWENYEEVKAKLTTQHTHWKKDRIKALDEKLKEENPSARAGQLGTRTDHIFKIPAHPNTTFDEENFLTLLEGSISLTMEEKERVIAAMPRLSMEQINELISIFEEEKQKFSELENEFAGDVQKLKDEREKEIQKVEVKKEEKSAGEDDAEKTAKIKREMGL
ncbi:hypothetical protein KAI58_04465 [Candidatus Gracilibacteria bacterium]|nr:hypothetical protein [Candidatus Gracilibacteria bacterium]